LNHVSKSNAWLFATAGKAATRPAARVVNSCFVVYLFKGCLLNKVIIQQADYLDLGISYQNIHRMQIGSIPLHTIRFPCQDLNTFNQFYCIPRQSVGQVSGNFGKINRIQANISAIPFFDAI